MKIYVASSWRNEKQPSVVAALREAGHEVYDFRNPKPSDRGFHWSDIDPKWQEWTPERFRRCLKHPIAVEGFETDMRALDWADLVVMVMPCGRSAHLELGYARGAGKWTAILLSGGKPELMYRMVHRLALDIPDLLEGIADLGWAEEPLYAPAPEPEKRDDDS
jgi:hypothetical protein